MVLGGDQRLRPIEFLVGKQQLGLCGSDLCGCLLNRRRIGPRIDSK